MLFVKLPPGFFFFNDTATTEIYTLSLHDALPIYARVLFGGRHALRDGPLDRLEAPIAPQPAVAGEIGRSEEHTSELQSQSNLVCRLLLEKKKERPVFLLRPPPTNPPRRRRITHFY